MTETRTGGLNLDSSPHSDEGFAVLVTIIIYVMVFIAAFVGWIRLHHKNRSNPHHG